MDHWTRTDRRPQQEPRSGAEYSYPAGGAGRTRLFPPERSALPRGRGGRLGNRTLLAIIGAGHLLAGLWLLVAPFAMGHLDGPGGLAATSNDVVIGAALMVIGFARIFAPTRTTTAGATAAGLGAWLVAAPIVFGYTDTVAVWNDIAVGVVVLVLALAARIGERRESVPTGGASGPLLG